MPAATIRATPGPTRHSRLRRLGALAFAFFLLKGLAWLAVPWFLFESVR
ncbi:MAG TPA: hypothetical protein VLT59_06830 [Steroidobacteraceae bacterium]|nr:hypothetical protein [Steroidobacteraceae bacterium]